MNVTFVKFDGCPKLHVFVLKSGFCGSLVKKLCQLSIICLKLEQKFSVYRVLVFK